MRHKFFKILLVALSLMCGMSAMAQSYISGEELRDRVPKQLRDKYDYENFELAVYKKYTINKNVKLTVYVAHPDGGGDDCFMLVTTNKKGKVIDIIETEMWEEFAYSTAFFFMRSPFLAVFDKNETELTPENVVSSHYGYNTKRPVIKGNKVTIYAKYMVGILKDGSDLYQTHNNPNSMKYFDTYVINDRTIQYEVTAKGYFKHVKTINNPNDIARFNKKYKAYRDQDFNLEDLENISIGDIFKPYKSPILPQNYW